MPQTKKIITSAPGKLMLAGSYAVVHGRPAMVTSVDQRLWMSVELINQPVLQIVAPGVGVESYSKPLAELGGSDQPKAVRFVESLVAQFLEKHPELLADGQGLAVTTQSDFTSTVGFGSSSAVTVALAKALAELGQISLENKALFDIAYQTIIDVQGVGSGFDLAAAIWGGALKYVWPAAVVEPLQLVDGALSEHLVVGYTGLKADTPTMVKMVNAKLADQEANIQSLFDKVGASVEKMQQGLQSADWSLVGQALNDHQSLMQKLGVSTPELEALCAAARKAGAFGAGLSGAGGGDCMLAVVGPDQRTAVAAAMSQVGEVIPVAMQAEGVRLESAMKVKEIPDV